MTQTRTFFPGRFLGKHWQSKRWNWEGKCVTSGHSNFDAWNWNIRRYSQDTSQAPGATPVLGLQFHEFQWRSWPLQWPAQAAGLPGAKQPTAALCHSGQQRCFGTSPCTSTAAIAPLLFQGLGVGVAKKQKPSDSLSSSTSSRLVSCFMWLLFMCGEVAICHQRVLAYPLAANQPPWHSSALAKNRIYHSRPWDAIHNWLVVWNIFYFPIYRE